MAPHNHEYTTHYVNDKQTVTMLCDGKQFGAIQKSSRGWLPCAGESSLTGELPVMTDTKFPSPWVDVALAWVEDKHLGWSRP